jgi:hypothetical protein
MAYTKNMSVAARRHFDDGAKLLDGKSFDNAGYHFGFAAECAIKHKLLECGVWQDEKAFWVHWPDLKQSALLAIQGRQAQSMRSLLQRGNFMQNWAIVMRYADNASISQVQAERWRNDANEALGLLI